MRTEQWFERAAAYFNGIMTIEEARLFEIETSSSDELSQLMQLWRTTDAEASVYEQYKDDALSFIATHQKFKPDFINEPTEEFSIGTKESPSEKLKFPLWRWLAIASAITGMIFLIKMLTPPSKNNMPVAEHKINSDSIKNIAVTDSLITSVDESKRNDKNPTLVTKGHIQTMTLYAQAFAPDEIPENPNGPLDDAFFYYASAKYTNAIRAIDSAGSKALTRGDNAFTPIINFYAVYYKALSLMSLGNEAAAIPLLKQSVLLSPSEFGVVKAQWYLALAYVKQGNISSASATLQLLVNNVSAGSYKRKAEKLLSDLSK